MQASQTAHTARGSRSMLAQPVVLSCFAASLLLSAFLLFSVQPMFAKMVVPRLGGSPSVWAVAMCFFQAMLLAGYCYAHLLTRLVPLRLAVAVHLGVCAAAFAVLPVGLAPGWEHPPGENTQAWLLGLFAVSVGWPFFAVAANAPLLQAWFARTGHPHARDPYFLYGASNAGSMLALVSYPVAIEPLIGLAAQSSLWTAGFAGLIGLIAGSALLAIVREPQGAASTVSRQAVRQGRATGWRDRALWVVLAFIPSGLLVAFTTHITTDVASAPFLWIVPLALYLLTYVLVFRDRPRPAMALLFKAQPFFVGGALLALLGSGPWAWLGGALAGTGAFFTTAMICHRTLYERRPDVAGLTGFYLWMSFGGVLGGIFTALIAPVVFSLVVEYPLLLVLALLSRHDTMETAMVRSIRARPLVMTAVAVAAFAASRLLGALTASAGEDPLRAIVVAILAVCAAAAWRTGERKIPAIAAVLAMVMLLPAQASSTYVERSFFGVHRVLETADGQFRLLSHGTTVHGAQRLDQIAGAASARPVPASYYYDGGPMARLVAVARDRRAPGRRFTAGAVGLGAGAIACQAGPGEDWRFFEIDPAVARIAQDPALFTYMPHCQPGRKVIIGDARLTLAGETDGAFDYLLIDAFSSDTIPVHLMTVEAIRLFVSKISDDGLLVLHISNRYLDLEPVIEAAVAEIGGGVAGMRITDRTRIGDYDALPSTVAVIARSPAALDGLDLWAGQRRFGAPAVSPWTDDFSNILSALLRGLAG